MSSSLEPRLERLPAPAEGVALLELAGELDLAVSDRLHELIDAIIADEPRLAVADITGVDFMDSTMLRELLRAHRALEEAGSQLVVAGAQPAVARLLELTGTNEVFRLTETRADGLSA
ncbi:MAG: hypothetical protein QOF76_3923 [Solirubrobacteraceae bacterium]|jgi:anti-anti-sigma factor|nr:hypothetical protein [Solirubrobacteraceae bacterium]